MGSRLRRVTGDQYDNFSIDYVFENGMHIHSMCRQINGCANNVSERLQGSKGSTNCQNTITGLDGAELWNMITRLMPMASLPTGKRRSLRSGTYRPCYSNPYRKGIQ
jgi:hypothetical protein